MTRTTTAIPFLDLRAATAECRGEFDEAYARVMDSGWFLLGDELRAFEDEFARACGVEHAVAVSTGLDALVLPLRALGIGAGDEVIVPGHTFIATWLAVTAVGATPVPVDVELQTGNLDPTLVEAVITNRTRAILPVHLYGQVADMREICRIAEARGIAVVEDAAQAHLARRDGTTAGGFGVAAGFSFYPGKNLGALGDGGAVATRDSAVAEQVRMLRNYGSRRKYEHEVPGVNSRLDELQCAFLRVRLARLPEWNERRRAIAAAYLAGLDPARMGLPVVAPGSEPVWHLFPIRVGNREEARAALEALGVATLVHYPEPPHRSGAYAGGQYRALPVTDEIAATTLSLPIGPHLSMEQAEQVVEAVNAVVRPPDR